MNQTSRRLTHFQWAGVAYALPSQRSTLRLDEVNEYADSFCTNMHKWGLVGFDCCKLFPYPPRFPRRVPTAFISIPPAPVHVSPPSARTLRCGSTH